MKKIICFILLVALFAPSLSNENEKVLERQYENAFRKTVSYKNIQIYNTKDLTLELLENRTNKKVIVERCIGEVINGNSDGMTQDGCYISYKNMGEINQSERILTYFVYNPETNYFDDIIERYDFKLS